MKTKALTIVIIGVIFLVVAVSGCTSENAGTSKVIWDQNLSESTTNPVIDKYVTLPNGTRSVTIEYNNITGETNAYFQFETYMSLLKMDKVQPITLAISLLQKVQMLIQHPHQEI